MSPALSPRISLAARVVLAVAVAALAFVGGPAAAKRTKDEQRASLVWMLSAYELQLTLENLERIGPDVGELLVDILNTPKEQVRTRVRAVAALAFYPTEQSFDVLRSLLHERSFKGTELGLQVRRQALRSLGRGFGDRAVDDMLGLRTDPEPLVREAVALGLMDAASARALPTLETWLSMEPDLGVRIAVDRAVSRLRR